MSADVADSPRQDPTPAQPTPPTPPAPPTLARPASAPRGGTWRLSARGVRTVAVLELRQRVRSTRWIIVLAVWTAILGGLTTLVRFAVHSAMDPDDGPGGTATNLYDPGSAMVAEQASDAAGRTMFAIIIFLVLGLAGLVAPALTATSVNGDRAAGVLATMQTTLLSAAEIAVGKLLAAWTTALALLAAASPFIMWAYVEGGTPANRLLVTLLLLAFLLLVVCAVALGWSAVAARTSSSAVLTYLSVALLGLGLPMLFAVSLPLAMATEQVTVVQAEPSSTDPTSAPAENSTFTCVRRTQEMSRPHTERLWWLLAANPFVIVADAAPRPTGRDTQSDPLTAIRNAVREARLGPAEIEDWCTGAMYGVADPATGAEGTLQTLPKPDEVAEAETRREVEREALPVVWPFGLAANLVLGTAFVLVAIRRLRAPARKLARGTRIA
jgi:ABC-2 type transport system permease protein